MAEEEIKDPGTVTFNDVALYFSLRQWELLADWQKKLYKNVMREIHGALAALGYEIANPGILVRIQQSEEPCFTSNKTEGEDFITTKGLALTRPDILLRVKMEEALSSRASQTSAPKEENEEEELEESKEESKEEEQEEEEDLSTDSNTAVFDPELSLWIKQEDEPVAGGHSSALGVNFGVSSDRAPTAAAGGAKSRKRNVPSKRSLERKTMNKRNGLRLRDKILVLCAYENNESVGSLAAQFGVSKSQIMQIIKRREELLVALQNNVSGDRIRRQRRTTNDQLNSAVWEWLLSIRDTDILLTGRIIRDKALQIASEMGIRGFKASNGWLESFKKAHNIHRTSVPVGMVGVGEDRLDDWLSQMSTMDDR